MNKYVIIAAGGIGTRMQTELPKQYLLLHNVPILCITLKKFLVTFEDIHIIIAAPKEYIAYTKKLLVENGIENNIQIVEGGSTRFHSVLNGLQLITETEAIVFVHDAARCMVSPKLITQCYTTALEKGNAVPAVQSVDSLRLITENGNTILNRNKVRCIQTPQTFQLAILQKAFQQNYEESFTDEASVLEKIGEKINLIDGEISNIKITTPLDLQIAESIMI
jgi:2-C-methyl-D-erythritol 4-phosphate cytidylyltransferase